MRFVARQTLRNIISIFTDTAINFNAVLRPNKMDEDTLPRNKLQWHDDGYDWMSDPNHCLFQDLNGHHAIDPPSPPEYETEPGLSPDSSLQEGNFLTPTSMGQYSVMPATPSEDAFELSIGMSSDDDLNSMI